VQNNHSAVVNYTENPNYGLNLKNPSQISLKLSVG